MQQEDLFDRVRERDVLYLRKLPRIKVIEESKPSGQNRWADTCDNVVEFWC